MDSWNATQRLIASIDNLGKIYYFPLKKNHLVDDSGGHLFQLSVISTSVCLRSMTKVKHG